jgi:hypothetical protein
LESSARPPSGAQAAPSITANSIFATFICSAKVSVSQKVINALDAPKNMSNPEFAINLPWKQRMNNREIFV